MAQHPVRQAIKRALPNPITRMLAGTESYVRRMAAWRRVARDFKGRTSADQIVLRRSFAAAPRDMLRNLERWREPELVADAEVVVRGLGTFAVRGRTDDLGHVMPSMHAAIFREIRKHVCAGDSVIDAGANMGAVTVFLATCVGRSGRVVAVEMMPDTAKCLRRNLELNHLSHVHVVENALSSTAGEIVVAHVEPGVHGQASIALGAQSGRGKKQVEVRTTTLDQVAAALGDIAMIKLDLEGAEPQALRGAAQMLQRTRAMLFESWGGDGDETSRILREAGFAIEPVDGRNFLALRRA